LIFYQAGILAFLADFVKQIGLWLFQEEMQYEEIKQRFTRVAVEPAGPSAKPR